MITGKQTQEFTYKISGEIKTVKISAEINPINGLVGKDGYLFKGYASVDNIEYKDLNLSGYVGPQHIINDIINKMKRELKLEHGKKVHFDL